MQPSLRSRNQLSRRSCVDSGFRRVQSELRASDDTLMSISDVNFHVNGPPQIHGNSDSACSAGHTAQPAPTVLHSVLVPCKEQTQNERPGLSAVAACQSCSQSVSSEDELSLLLDSAKSLPQKVWFRSTSRMQKASGWGCCLLFWKGEAETHTRR